MGIRFQCEHCSKRLNVKAKQAGELCLCPGCESEIQIPTETPLAAVGKPIKRPRLKSPKLQARTSVSTNAQSVELRPVLESAKSPIASNPTIVETVPVASSAKAKENRGTQRPIANKVPRPQNVQQLEQPSTESFLLSKPETKIESNPLSSDENHVWYFRHKRLGEKGPLKSLEIEDLLDSGELCRGFIVWREDWNDWIAIEKVFPERFASQSSSAADTGESSAEIAVRRKRGMVVIAGLGVAAFLIIAVLVYLLITMFR